MSAYHVWSGKRRYLGSVLARDEEHALKQARANWPKFQQITVKRYKAKR